MTAVYGETAVRWEVVWYDLAVPGQGMEDRLQICHCDENCQVEGWMEDYSDCTRLTRATIGGFPCLNLNAARFRKKQQLVVGFRL